MTTADATKSFLANRELLDDAKQSAYEKTRRRSLEVYWGLLTISIVFIPTLFQVGNKAEAIIFWPLWSLCAITIYNFSKEVMQLWKLRSLFEDRQVIHFEELFSDVSTQSPSTCSATLFKIGLRERLTSRWLLGLYAVSFAAIMWDTLR